MTWKLIYTASYERRARKWLKRHPELKGQYLKTLQLLTLRPQHPSLRLHALHGTMEGLYSVSVNRAQRITLEFVWRDEEIVLINIGSHDEADR